MTDFRARLHTLVLLSFLVASVAWGAEPPVPGHGTRLENVGDDFEAIDWEWYHHWPKSSENLNRSQHAPGGESKNGRWYEGIKRGHPDVVQRVPTPSGGLPRSKGSLLLHSLYTGVSQSPSHQQQQDDFIADIHYRLGGGLSVTRTPSVVTHVFLPPVDQWENRTGCHFAFRCSVDTTIRRVSFARNRSESEVYYPGFFLDFESKEESGADFDRAVWRIRAAQDGSDFPAKEITTTGWWTLGMSFTSDGQVHYFARPGITPLTAADHVTTQTPYGYRCEQLRTLFFNVCNGDDGRTWSTKWIVDDTHVYVSGNRP